MMTNEANAAHAAAEGEALWSKATVIATVGLGASTLEAKVSRGEFPRPIYIGEGGYTRRWVKSEVMAWLRAQIEANATRTRPAKANGGRLANLAKGNARNKGRHTSAKQGVRNAP